SLAPQQIFKIGNKTAREPGCCLSSHVYKKVHVALDCFFPASYRAEKEHVPSAMACGDAKDLVAAVLHVLPGTHSLTLDRQSAFRCGAKEVRRKLYLGSRGSLGAVISRTLFRKYRPTLKSFDASCRFRRSDSI
ncbi:MAG TPA: hypothetical protein VIX89_18400, partial [Bryobacteraceae bacterium]